MTKAMQLAERGVAVEIHWMPGNMLVKVTERAKETAKMKVKMSGMQRGPERFTSPVHIKHTVTERK